LDILGHDAAVAALKHYLGPVTLLVGPRSVGKWTTAEHLRRYYGVGDADLLRINRLTADTARAFVSFASTAPHGETKMAIVNLAQASAPATASLLKTLEDAGPQFRAILTSEREAVRTITSRATVYPFSLLSEEDLIEILVTRYGMGHAAAQVAAQRGYGQVKPALDAAKGFEDKITVLAALSALKEHDPDTLDRLADKWTDAATELLSVWCREQVTGRWKTFTNEETEMTGKALALKILFALNADIRPRLVVRSSLMSILRGA
jgi:hypothetical protein